MAKKQTNDPKAIPNTDSEQPNTDSEQPNTDAERSNDSAEQPERAGVLARVISGAIQDVTNPSEHEKDELLAELEAQAERAEQENLPAGGPREPHHDSVRTEQFDLLVDCYELALLDRPMPEGVTPRQSEVVQAATTEKDGWLDMSTAALLETAREWFVASPGEHDTQLLDALTNAGGHACLTIVHQLAQRLQDAGVTERRAIDSTVLGAVIQGDEQRHLRNHSIPDCCLPLVLAAVIELREAATAPRV